MNNPPPQWNDETHSYDNWVLLLRQGRVNNSVFVQANATWKTDYQTLNDNNYSFIATFLANINDYKILSGSNMDKFHFALRYNKNNVNDNWLVNSFSHLSATDNKGWKVWYQTNSPNTGSRSGYSLDTQSGWNENTNTSESWSGMATDNGDLAVWDGTPGGNWWWAVGTRSHHGGGIPGDSSIVRYGVEMWVNTFNTNTQVAFASSSPSAFPVDVSLGIVSWYDGASFDTTNNKWVDKAGSLDLSSDYITGTISKKSLLLDSVLISNRNNKRYHQSKLPIYLSGSKNSGITFNKDASYQFLTDGSYTFFHAARRDPSDVNQTGRVFDGSGGDWYSGFNDASSGVAKHENDSINTIDKEYGTNWVVSVDTPKYYRSVGYSDTSSGYYETSSGNRTDTNTTTPQISVHYGSNTFQGPIGSGGIITNYSNYCISTFLSSGTLSVSRNTTADFLIVGGGGGGGGQTHIGGGGGAGGVVIATNQSLAAGSYNVNVGNGGGILIPPTTTNGTSESYNNGDDYISYTFINSGTFTTDTSTIIDFILIGGGGGGGSEIGGGGGGGGVVIGTSQTINSGTYNITIGTGGSGGTAYGSTKIGSNGNDTTFNGFIAKGSGGGGYHNGSSIHPIDGGSGGGCGADNGGKSNKGDSNQDNYSNSVNVTGYGNDGYGAAGNYGSTSVGGGGGGAGTIPTSEDGGDGISNNFKTGIDIYYGGGGGGGSWARNRGLGGLGGGGNSDTSIAANGDDGVDGLGGGGGGGGGSGKPGGDGGSGIVIIRINTSSSGSSGVSNGSDSTFNGFVAKGGGGGGIGNYIDAIHSSDVSGGTESQYSIGNVTYQLHSFTQTGDNTLTITKDIIADFMLVGGGGGGSGRHGGGGGGGGVVIGTNNILSAGTYNIRIGSGGLGGDFADIDNTLGFDGSNTELSGNVLIISKGGGGGGGGNSNSTPVILNANPTLAGSITSTGWNSGQSPGTLQGVAVDDERNLAFVSDWASKFFVINTTNKSSPQHIGYITDSKLNQSWMPVYDKARKHVFVSTYTSGGIVAINVVNPATPSIVSEIKNQTILGGAHVIQFDSARNLVYVCGYNANAIVIVDVSNLNNLTISGYIQGTTYTSGPLALDYDSVRELVFSINYGDGSLTIIDVSNKTTPTVISKTTDSRFDRAWGAAYDVERKLLFVPRRTYNIIHIIDVTNTSSPTFRGSYDDGASYLQNPYAIDFDQNRKLLYLTSYSKNGIVIVSTSDPDNPTRIGWLHDANSMSGAMGLDFNSKEDIICVSGKNGSDFAVIDINQPPFLNNTGTNGGSGGGGTYANSGGSAKYYDTNGLVSNLNGGSATVSTNIIAYGNDGGVGQDNGYWPSGGGGGAGGVGGSPSTNQQSPGDGGIGIQNNFLTNSNIYYAGGGGASSKLTDVGGSSGGSGCGGDGKAVGSGNGGDAIANTGGGGGAGGGDAYRGGHGGSGYALVRFAYNDLLEKGDADIGGSGGGGGGNYLAGPSYPGGNDGTDGGSSSQDTYSSTTNVSGYGSAGGGFTGIPASEGDDAGGGGGGAGGVGSSRSANGVGTGNGGIGIHNDFRTNSLIYYAGGGGGGSGTSSTPGTGGSSLGGSGSNSSSVPSSALANSGGGGGGGNIVVNGGDGADGIVVVRLTETPPAQQCDWNVGEVISYNRILDISDENKVFDYLKHRYLGTGQSTTGEVYQLPGDVSGGATIRGFPPEFPDTNNILGWYIPESYDASGFWRDVTPFQNDLSSGGTAPEYVKNDKTYTTLSYLKGVKADSDNEIVASGYKFPEQFLPSDGSYTMIHVSRRISNTGRIFDSASNKNFYSGFVGNKSGVALHSIDVSSGGGGGGGGGQSSFPTTNPYYNASNAGPPNFIELAASDFVVGGSRHSTNLPYYGLGHTHTWPISTFINSGGQKEGYDSINLDNSAPGNSFERSNPNSDQSPPLDKYVTQVYWIWWRVTDSDWRTLWRGNVDHWIIVESGSKDLGMYSNRNGGFRDSGLNITTGKWQFLACVSEGDNATSSTGTGTLYLGNLGENNLTPDDSNTIDRVPSGTSFYRFRWGGGQDPGWIAYSAIWSGSDSKYALSRSELDELYKQGIPIAGQPYSS